MKFARLENNVVVETIDFDPQGKFTTEIVTQFKECPEDVEQKWEYINNKWLKPKIIEYIPTKEDINNQVVAKIRERYDINKEFQMHRLALQNPSSEEYLAYLQYIQECIDWGVSEKIKYGFIEST
jgi:hypothetical protein